MGVGAAQALAHARHTCVAYRAIQNRRRTKAATARVYKQSHLYNVNTIKTTKCGRWGLRRDAVWPRKHIVCDRKLARLCAGAGRDRRDMPPLPLICHTCTTGTRAGARACARLITAIHSGSVSNTHLPFGGVCNGFTSFFEDPHATHTEKT